MKHAAAPKSRDYPDDTLTQSAQVRHTTRDWQDGVVLTARKGVHVFHRILFFLEARRQRKIAPRRLLAAI